MATSGFQIGDARIDKVLESVRASTPPKIMFPSYTPELLARIAPATLDQIMTADRSALLTSSHSWLVRTPRHTILVDTGSGNAKNRPGFPIFHQLSNPYLERLAAFDVAPEDVDFVLLTHLHADHVGWNTVLQDGAWRSTFPRAAYVFSEHEYRHYGDPQLGDPLAGEVIADSVRPVVDAGQAVMVGPGPFDPIPGIFFRPTPGHTVDHFSIELKSHGQTAIFAGDVMHSALQVYAPAWHSQYCEDSGRALTSRNWLLDYVAEREALYLSTHFQGPSAGRIGRTANGFVWTYA